MHLIKAITLVKGIPRLNMALYSTKKLIQQPNIKKLRNIGILAHIDAGKTTTTERMLFYSGTITHMGEVHHGNTVTDYMEQERNRGITIRSAAVSFPWKNYQFNLIDTPGHIDFTMEVEQSLSVLDGAIVILDGSAGVEAQTLTVWRQAHRYDIPKIIFVNKMDRADADYEMSCKSVEDKLDCRVLPLHIPIKENGKLVGIVDVLTLEQLKWNPNSKEESFMRESLEENNKLYSQAKESRNHIIDIVSEHDDSLANMIIEAETLENIKTTDIIRAIKSTSAKQKLVPVLCGSAYKNIGIQPLMDAVILYLPSPDEINNKFKIFDENLSARCFKIIHDNQRGVLAFFRTYTGKFIKGQKLYNINRDLNEQAQKLLLAYADDFEEVDHLSNGNIAVLTGLKKTMMGDLVTNSSSIVENCKKKLKEDDDNIFESNTKIPDPVFFCSIEPPSLSYQSALEKALSELEREDPSLRVSHDQETGQIVLAGMGELHLEIIKDRILKEYKVEAELGPFQISYRESPLSTVKGDLKTETRIGNSKQSVSVELSVIPVENDDGRGILKLDRSSDAMSALNKIYPKHLAAVREGVEVASDHGPKLGAKMINMNVMLHMLEVGRGTSETMISATTTQCIHQLLKKSGSRVLEPIMYLEVITPSDYLSVVLADLGKRRSAIQDVTVKGKNKMVICETPLSDLMGYSTTLRTLTSGTGTFGMEFSEFKCMSSMDENKAIESVRGF